MGGHGYAAVRALSDAFETEFVCIPRPIERAEHGDGGPILYRVKFSSKLWRDDEEPKIKVQVVSGDPTFSL